MRRALLSGLFGIMMMGLGPTQAFGQDGPDAQPPADADQATEEPKAEPPLSVVPAPAPAPAAIVPVAPALPTAKPTVGSLSTHGYFRGGWGGNVNQKGRMTCFGLSTITGGLKSKYRLGNECEQWGEFHLTAVAFVGEDGSVGRFHFTPVAYIPTSYIGYSPTSTTATPDLGHKSTGAAVSFPNLYADIQGISWLYGGTVWAGSRYYKREDVYISDFFYWNPSGVGGGIEDINLGKIWADAPASLRDLRLSYAAFAVDGEPKGEPPLPGKFALGIRSDVQLRGFRPYEGGELQVGFQHIADWSAEKDDSGEPAYTHGGWGITFRHVQNVLGGTNKFVVQYGKGGGTGFGTLSRFYYPDFSLNWAKTETRLRLLDVITVQPTPWLGAQLVGVYQRDDDGRGKSDSVVEWFSAGGRLSLAVADHAKLLGEVGYDDEVKSNGAPPLWLLKATGAIAFAAAPGFWARPEIRLFYTYATWSDAARIAGIDSGRVYAETYTTFLAASVFGLQAEAMW